jgi:hypothetical protein
VLIGYISEKTRSLPRRGGILDQSRNDLRRLEKTLMAFDRAREDESKKYESQQRLRDKVTNVESE